MSVICPVSRFFIIHWGLCKSQDFLCRLGSCSTAVLEHMCEEIRNEIS